MTLLLITKEQILRTNLLHNLINLSFSPKPTDVFKVSSEKGWKTFLRIDLFWFISILFLCEYPAERKVWNWWIFSDIWDVFLQKHSDWPLWFEITVGIWHWEVRLSFGVIDLSILFFLFILNERSNVKMFIKVKCSC